MPTRRHILWCMMGSAIIIGNIRNMSKVRSSCSCTHHHHHPFHQGNHPLLSCKYTTNTFSDILIHVYINFSIYLFPISPSLNRLLQQIITNQNITLGIWYFICILRHLRKANSAHKNHKPNEILGIWFYILITFIHMPSKYLYMYFNLLNICVKE